MSIFELQPKDITDLSDGDLRELVARLCEAELAQQSISTSCVTWGGAQEAPDGGLDVRVKNAGHFSAPNFVPRANTGLQVKKHTMGKAACRKEMLKDGKPKEIIKELSENNGAYIIVSGKDDCSEQMLIERQSEMRGAVEALEKNENLATDFYGRDRIAAWLRLHPGVSLWARDKLGKILSGWEPYGRWAATPVDCDDDFLFDEYPCVTSTDQPNKEPVSLIDGVQLARNKLKPTGSTVRITGLSGVGKTRFAQALFEDDVGTCALPASNSIYADLGNELSPTASELVAYLIANDLDTFLVLDNCPPDVHRKLQNQVSKSGAKLHLLTIEYDISDDHPEETEVIHIEPTSEETVTKLVRRRFPNLGRTNADRIAEFAGGNARLSIALASRVQADETLTNFSDDDLFKRLFSQRKDTTEQLLASAEVLSIVYSFSTSASEGNNELSALAEIGGIERSVLYRSQAELLRRQVAQKRGDWRAVLPHALANRLATRALQNIAIPDINAVLFKPENLRLLKSCAHRLGYLHDFEPARLLAESWIEKDAPLADVGSCCEDRIEALDFIAPVFPSTVLEALEVAAQDPEFTTRTNPHFSTIVRLLCKLAYEEESFHRATTLILRFAESESSNENNNSIVSQLKQLFSLYLSGTLASPAQRHNFVGRLLESSNPRHLEIAREIFYSALETSHWSSVASFGFGARKRTTGWAPRTREERDHWYVGYIELLETRLHSPNLEERLLARDILSSRFRGLWSFAGCFDRMEQLVREHAYDGAWPEMWLSIKQTIFFDGEKIDPKIHVRLKSLENLAAPSNAYSEIEAYAFANTWDHAEVKGGDYSQKVKVVEEKIRDLGVLAASDPDLLTRLGPRLWAKNINALWHFGAGIADGADDKEAMFYFLVKLLQFQKQEHIYPTLFSGYLRAVYDSEPKKCRLLQERVLENPELKPFFVYLLSATPIAPWGAKKLVEVAQEGSLEAFRFEHLSLGRIHEAICDAQLAEILRAVNDLDGGAVSTIEILGMRFFVDKDSDYVPNEEIRSIGRHAVSKVVQTHRDDVSHNRLSGEDRVLDQCFPPDSPENEVRTIIDSICDGLLEYRVYGHEIDPILAKLVENFPEMVLNQVYGAGEKKELLAHFLFRDRISRRRSFLNAVSVERLLEWCADDDQKIKFATKAVTKFVSPLGDDSEFEHPKDVVLSEHILALLEVAQDKEMIAQYIFESIRPSSYSGSEADIIQTRKIAFEELLAYPDKAIQQFAQGKVSGLEETIKRIRDYEAKEFGRREQRFE